MKVNIRVRVFLIVFMYNLKGRAFILSHTRHSRRASVAECEGWNFLHEWLRESDLLPAVTYNTKRTTRVHHTNRPSLPVRCRFHCVHSLSYVMQPWETETDSEN